jgi:hypothetical protein
MVYLRERKGVDMVERKYDTHAVIKRTDIKRYLSVEEAAEFNRMCDIIAFGRYAEDRSSEYYVCNVDEPYADRVLEAILTGENCKERKDE